MKASSVVRNFALPAYYNEIDPYAAQWLRNLIKAGHIPAGEVDERSIREVHQTDLFGFGQCHFFAGIGGWAYAARLAGWPDDKPMWTGSCPCQPFSAAGKRTGVEDDRHLWPEFARLIGQCKPSVVFGEQVASSDGRKWLSGVRLDLEALGYGVGAADLCAASVGAPHIRQRLWWVAESDKQQCHRDWATRNWRNEFADSGGIERMVNAASEQMGISGQSRQQRDAAIERVGIPNSAGRESRQLAPAVTRQGNPFKPTSCWADFDIVQCADGKARRIESGTFPLAHGVSARVGKLPPMAMPSSRKLPPK